MSAPQGWEGILDRDEQILWQGRPDQDFHMAAGQIFAAIFGLFFAGFALFWMVMASRGGGPMWMFGLIHFSVGVYMVWWSIYGATYSRRNTWYTLTDKRAFIATDFLTKGRELNSYPITADMRFRFHEGELSTIHFAQERRKGSKGRSYTVDVGFERIDEGEKVLKLMHKIQDRERGIEEAEETGEEAKG